MTSKPDDIPQDVWDAAVRALDLDGSPLELLAGVIMDERERCAKVSEAFGDAIAIAGPSGEFLSLVPYVAGAIRSGLPIETVRSLSQEGVWLAQGGGFALVDKGWDRQVKLTPGKP